MQERRRFTTHAIRKDGKRVTWADFYYLESATMLAYQWIRYEWIAETWITAIGSGAVVVTMMKDQEAPAWNKSL